MSAEDPPAAADAAAFDACVRAMAAPGGFSALFAARMPQLLQARETGLEVAWRRLALGLGHDAYEAGRLVEALWRSGDVAAARAQVPISRATLADRAFAENGHPFHLEKIGQMLGDFLAVFDYEAGALADDDVALADLHPVVVAALYDALWRALTELDFARARRYALRYLAQTGHTPTSLHVIRYGLQATGFHVEAGVQARALAAAEGDALVELRRLAVAARSAAEAGDGAALAGALAQADGSIDAATAGAAAADEAGAHALAELALVAAMTALAADDPASGRARLQAWRAAVEASEGQAPAARLGLIEARLADAAGEAEAALDLRRAAAAAGLETLDETSHVAIDHLAARGFWAEAAALYAGAVRSIQAGIAPAGSPAAERAAARLERADPLEAEGQIISGWGIGDDILRLAMLTRLAGREQAYLYHLDARLCELAGRALPAMRFAASFTRIVDEAGRRAFWAAREGVPIGLDAHRLTRERLEAMQAGVPTMQSEEILHAYLLSRGEARFPFAPIFAASPAAGARMAARLAGLPAGRPRIALAWRSSLRGADRDVYFCAVEDLAPLFEADVTIIVAQPRLSPAERDWLAAWPNAVVWDDVDFWDDFDAQAALFPRLDLVVSTKLSLRDFSAACGARTLSLSLGHAHVEGARLAPDGASDRIFPTLTHLPEARYGGRAGVIAEAARRLAQLAEGGPAQG